MKEHFLFKPPQWHILIYQVPLAILFGDYTNLSSDTAAMLFQFVLLSMTDIKTFLNYNFTTSVAASKKEKVKRIEFQLDSMYSIMTFFMTNGEKGYD